jgi:hypothetical protein
VAAADVNLSVEVQGDDIVVTLHLKPHASDP